MLSNYKKSKGYHYTYTIGDFHSDYVKAGGTYSRKIFTKVCVRILEILKQEIIENRVHFNIPHIRGKICIRKVKHHKAQLNAHRINWSETKKLGKYVYYLNMHTDRYYFRWKWERGPRNSIGKGEIFYSFKPVRAATRALAAHIKKCASDPEIKDYDVNG